MTLPRACIVALVVCRASFGLCALGGHANYLAAMHEQNTGAKHEDGGG